MNTANNQRFQETDRRIRTVMLELIKQKDINKITVNDICKDCGINRSTFYAHFVDIYDLMDKMQMEIYQDIQESFKEVDFQPDNFLTPDYLVILFEHIRRNRLFYRVYLDQRDVSIGTNWKIVLDQFMRPYFHSIGVLSERQIQYQFRFFWAGLIETLRIWVNDGCPEEPQELVNIIWRSVKGFPERKQ